MIMDENLKKLIGLVAFDVSAAPMTREEYETIVQQWKIPQEMLVAITGVSRSTIRNYVSGRTPFKQDFAVKLRQIDKAFCLISQK